MLSFTEKEFAQNLFLTKEEIDKEKEKLLHELKRFEKEKREAALFKHLSLLFGFASAAYGFATFSSHNEPVWLGIYLFIGLLMGASSGVFMSKQSVASDEMNERIFHLGMVSPLDQELKEAFDLMVDKNPSLNDYIQQIEREIVVDDHIKLKGILKNT